MNTYLEVSEHIDWRAPAVFSKARNLAEGLSDPEEIARACFEFVRDEIKHSWDYKMNPVTCKASDALAHKTGYCYAKSHLLAALLRANNIPAGLCYQRLTITNDKSPFCLHGLNAVYLEKFGWYRLDARGNKEGVSAQFCPPIEKLAYSISTQGEADLPEIWAQPHPAIIKALSLKSYQEVADNLPDIEILPIYK
ncbi:transglutaminase-like domain-containing protein [Neptunomonas japonica]|uniref:transglutaminase-like domain-containing protein n=1 Tax=Neptunomonas japonica TaxID=417574 RepID=UPI000400C38C|nr:transglutaminase family protein [Neptunomonas japonica]